MRINRLVLENYALFAGLNEFDLAPRAKGEKKRPIVLVGGMNGAGKTTILDAIKLALYGKTALGDRISQKEYHQHLRSLIHRSRSLLINAPYSRVALEFDFVTRGQQETYYIERSWQSNNGSGISEDFQVRVKPADAPAHLQARDWPLLNNTEPEYWQEFVSDIVPTRLSQLFFFDGEKIRKIASDISGSTAIGESIRSLIGLDIVDRLRADLSIYAARETRSFGTAAESEKISDLSKALEDLQNRSAQLLSEELPQLETQILGAQREIGRLETRLQEEGSSFADKRQEYQQRLAVLEHRNSIVLKDISNAAEGLFPLALCPTVARKLLNHLRSVADLKDRLLISEQHQKLKEEIVKKLKSSRLPADTNERTRVISLVEEILLVDVSAASSQNASFAIELSEGETAKIQGCLNRAADSEFSKMHKLCKELESINREVQNIKQKLARVPEQESLQPLFADLSKKNQELGTLLSRRSALQEESRQVQASIVTKERERNRLLATIQTTENASKRLVLVSTVQTALDSYLSRLTQFKTNALSVAVARCFNQISRKEDLIREILVDPNTFAVTLLDNSGLPIPKEELSSGEKQILAIALLWGLAQTSGRPLPVIIDTPLGRLDSAHRNNLVKHYFPHAAHQVILLSTDTEVDKELFQELKHGVSHCYHLIYDQQETRTYVKREYFWEEEENV